MKSVLLGSMIVAADAITAACGAFDRRSCRIHSDDGAVSVMAFNIRPTGTSLVEPGVPGSYFAPHPSETMLLVRVALRPHLRQ